MTITKLAQLTGFSISTVSKALSNSTDISENARSIIIKCAVENGYVLNTKKKKSKGIIAVVTQGFNHKDSNVFEYYILFGFQLAASQAGYEIKVIQASKDSNWNYKNIITNEYLGTLILRMSYYDESLSSEIIESKIPTVLFDHYIDAQNVGYVGTDNELGINYAINHLSNLGHKVIGFYGGSPTALVSIARKAGFIQSLRNHGLTVYPEIIMESNFSQNFAAEIIPKMVSFGATAIVCSSDLLASFAIDELTKMGLRVPDDISLIGFDNVPLAEELNPKLTTINQNGVELGKSSFYVLKKLMEGVSISQLLFRPTLVIRDSTKSVK